MRSAVFGGLGTCFVRAHVLEAMTVDGLSTETKKLLADANGAVNSSSRQKNDVWANRGPSAAGAAEVTCSSLSIAPP